MQARQIKRIPNILAYMYDVSDTHTHALAYEAQSDEKKRGTIRIFVFIIFDFV